MSVLLFIVIYLLLVNGITFYVYGSDKKKAEHGKWRTSEGALLLLAFLGGSIGALIGMKAFHHKTRKWKFRILVPLFLVLQILLAIGLIGFLFYVGDYYPAKDAALKNLQSDETVQVTPIKEGYYFDGPGSDSAIIFYPGAKVQTEAYAPLLHDLADKGTDCFLVDMPYHLAIFGKDKASDLQKNGRYQYESWYMAGHSLGGAMAGSYAADHQDQLAGIIFLAAYPVKDLQSEGFRVLSVYGSEDKVLNMDHYEENRIHLADDAAEHVIQGGNHAGFGCYGPQDEDGEAEISADKQQEETVELIREFLVGDSRD